MSGYEARLPGLTLPDEDDRHVLTAAIEAGASVIITFNLSDFPRKRWSRMEFGRCIPTPSW